ncbi:glycosyltransferase, group 2 family protein [Selenomonas sp. oral taxon 137 str. F0430]|uniref:methyltransferase domain-containing protein n=1 Tax=Selenomonas sp. oral taxon 137 TaxID=712531 RepID=UPI0001EB25AE|nr:methyltransferase domain-containing protein [Selenomonas sp. oral taxon 137]EFR42039.1 glycosyltransferase, group 2 family protein [Selenomonas sp. oral taxon 137 str. F0430]
MPKLSIIIPVYRMNTQLRQCITSIRRTVRIPYEIIVVDDGTPQGEEPPHPPFGENEIRILRSKEHHSMAHVLRMGLQEAEGDVILFLHADIMLSPYTVEDMLDALIAHPEIGAVSAVAMRMNEHRQFCPQLSYRGWEDFAAAAQQLRSGGLTLHPTLYLELFCLMARRDAVGATGLPDEDYRTPCMTAIDYTLRMVRAGYRLGLLPSVYVHHQEDDHARNMDAYDKEILAEADLFHEKWGVSLTYSFGVRDDLFPLMDLSAEDLRILEIGCACGATLMEIGARNPSAKLYGVELNERAAEIARTYADVLAMDVERVDENDIRERFDYILMPDVIEHLLDPWTALRNMRKLLAPGGCIVAGIPNVAHISNLYHLLRGMWQYEDAGLLDRTHFRFFTQREIALMFEGAGLRIEDMMLRRFEMPAPIMELRRELLSLQSIKVRPEDLDAYQWCVRARRE